MDLSLELERAQAEAEFRLRKIEVELEQARAVARMKLLQLKEALCRRLLVQSRSVRNNYSGVRLRPKTTRSEPCCSKNVSKDYLCLYVILLAREANTASCVFVALTSYHH